jgi:Family of unknown function (DUF6220)
MVRTTAQRIHPWLAGLFAVAVLVQAFLAGVALPQLGGSGDFTAHQELGYTGFGILALLVLIAGGLGRADRLQIWGSIGLFVLYVVQTVLPTLAGSSPLLAALHPANAILLFALAAWMFVAERRSARA